MKMYVYSYRVNIISIYSHLHCKNVICFYKEIIIYFWIDGVCIDLLISLIFKMYLVHKSHMFVPSAYFIMFISIFSHVFVFLFFCMDPFNI